MATRTVPIGGAAGRLASVALMQLVKDQREYERRTGVSSEEPENYLAHVEVERAIVLSEVEKEGSRSVHGFVLIRHDGGFLPTRFDIEMQLVDGKIQPELNRIRRRF